MTTEGEIIPIERDIHQLLNESTYQGMTDAEIQKIIDYKVAIAQMSGESSALAAHSAAIVAQLQELCQMESARQELMLQSAMNLEIPWVTVSKEGTVNSNV